MKDFKDKVAVITGAASGIGRALAAQAAKEGMKVVLADVEQSALNAAADELKAADYTVLAVRTDVSVAGEVEALARTAVDSFGAVHLLFNNAGVGVGTAVWEGTMSDWNWVLGVNLWGVIHGVRTFVPLMLKQAVGCHIVNTASVAGLVPKAGIGIYSAASSAIVALSEALHQELGDRGARIGVSVLCPSWVKTQILSSVRNRPAEYQDDTVVRNLKPHEEREVWAEIESDEDNRVIMPEEAASIVFEGIREERFYIFTHPESKELVRKRMEDILNDRNPAGSRR